MAAKLRRGLPLFKWRRRLRSLAGYSWTLAARQAPAPAGAAVVQERPEPRGPAETMQGRVAMVTGGATGLGRAVCLGFAHHGAPIAFNYLGFPQRHPTPPAP